MELKQGPAHQQVTPQVPPTTDQHITVIGFRQSLSMVPACRKKDTPSRIRLSVEVYQEEKESG